MDALQRDILFYLVDDALAKLRKKSAKSDASALLLREFLTTRNEIERDNIPWHAHFTRLHELYGYLGGVLTADHWQSPAYDQYAADEAGDERGKIVGNFNDYKRDQHPVGLAWERAFAAAYVPRFGLKKPQVFTTASGMAALTLAVTAVKKHVPHDGMIAVGKHSYFQNKELLTALFREDRIIYFDETKPEGLAGQDVYAVFFDSVANDLDMTVADMPGMTKVVSNMSHRVYVVADATCLSTPRFHVSNIPKNISMLVWESLVKFHQFALDRAHGGVLWAVNVSETELYFLRSHAGVILPEWSAAVLPSPNRKLFFRYMERLIENAAAISAHLHHPCPGPFICFTEPSVSVRQYREYIKRVMQEAKKRGIPLVAGSSFGLPVTRVYAVGMSTRFVRPFLRVSPGIESSEEIERVGHALYESVQNFL